MHFELQTQNRNLRRDIQELLQYIEVVDIPLELYPFRAQLRNTCVKMREICDTNLKILESEQKTNVLLDEIISNTSSIHIRVRNMSDILVPALIRNPHGTHLSLKILVWIHRQHLATAQNFPVVRDGGWSIMPSRTLPIYCVPLLQQHRLLMQPLLFHEFGHQLHLIHKIEIDDLIREFQIIVLRKLNLPFASNDRYYERQLAKHHQIAMTWYSWLSELFCDAVGFHIGGPSYLRAFSFALTSMRREDFRIEQEFIMGSSHPVPWLRVQFLAKRAESAGFVDLANRVRTTWAETATALNIEEDYYGMYDEILEEDVIQIIDDMLVEANPRSYSETELTTTNTNILNSPVRLLYKAWELYENRTDSYFDWEKQIINQYLTTPFEQHTIQLFHQLSDEEIS
jgi:hypothetical protein